MKKTLINRKVLICKSGERWLRRNIANAFCINIKSWTESFRFDARLIFCRIYNQYIHVEWKATVWEKSASLRTSRDKVSVHDTQKKAMKTVSFVIMRINSWPKSIAQAQLSLIRGNVINASINEARKVACKIKINEMWKWNLRRFQRKRRYNFFADLFSFHLRRTSSLSNNYVIAFDVCRPSSSCASAL